MSENISSGSLSPLFFYRELSNNILIRHEGLVYRYELPIPENAYLTTTNRPCREKLGYYRYALFIFETNGDVWLGDINNDGEIFKRNDQGEFYPLKPTHQAVEAHSLTN